MSTIPTTGRRRITHLHGDERIVVALEAARYAQAGRDYTAEHGDVHWMETETTRESWYQHRGVPLADRWPTVAALVYGDAVDKAAVVDELRTIEALLDGDDRDTIHGLAYEIRTTYPDEPMVAFHSPVDRSPRQIREDAARRESASRAVQAATTYVEQIRDELESAEAARRQRIRQARDAGVSVDDIASAAGLSRPRVYQILAGPK